MMEPIRPVSIQTPLHVKHSVVSVLTYFEIFEHPLRSEEILRFVQNPDISLRDIESYLENAVRAGEIHRYGEFFQIPANSSWSVGRIKKNKKATEVFPKARRMGHLIGKFPFVRSVMISGSLSKNSMPEDGDVDFFIITQPGRLWLARTLLILYKKIFLFNSRKYFCVNYFIDSDHLEIEEKNLFTATECATVIPVFGGDMYQRFLAANLWVKEGYFPNFSGVSDAGCPVGSISRAKRMTEFLLSGIPGSLLDTFCMRLTVGFWRKKFRHFDNNRFDLALKSRKYVSKHHPLWFQERVLGKHKELMASRI